MEKKDLLYLGGGMVVGSIISFFVGRREKYGSPSSPKLDLERGYRGVSLESMELSNFHPLYSDYITEGDGIYIVHKREVAEWFGDVVYEIDYRIPKKILSSHQTNCTTPLLDISQCFDWKNENDLTEIVKCIRSEQKEVDSNDTWWEKLNKQALRNVGITDNNWYHREKELMRELTRLLGLYGYDAVEFKCDQITHKNRRGSLLEGGIEWTVLLDKSLVFDYRRLD